MTTSAPSTGLDAAVAPLFDALDDRFAGLCESPTGHHAASEGLTCAHPLGGGDTDLGPQGFLVWFLDEFTGEAEAPFEALDGVPSVVTAVIDGGWVIVGYHDGGYSPSISDVVDLGPDGVASGLSFTFAQGDLVVPGASTAEVVRELSPVLGEPSADSGGPVPTTCGDARTIIWRDLEVGFVDDRLAWWWLDGPADLGSLTTPGRAPWPFGEPIEALDAEDVGPAIEDASSVHHEFATSITGRSVRAILDDGGLIVAYSAGDCPTS